jgi:hypothetical protein
LAGRQQVLLDDLRVRRVGRLDVGMPWQSMHSGLFGTWSGEWRWKSATVVPWKSAT